MTYGAAGAADERARLDESDSTATDFDSPRPALVLTGIPGLDDILDGGLPAEHLYLVEGEPGTGKTTLSLQFLLEGRARGERGVYVTLSETGQELEGVARSHGWTLEGISVLDMVSMPDGGAPEEQYTIFHPSEVELQSTVGAILSRVGQVAPTRVVLDSLSEMRLLARDPLRFRRQILALKQYFTSRGITVLMLDARSAGDTEMQLHSLAHGVIRLQQLVLSHGAERRQLRVSKLRGVRFHAGYHDFVIRTGGVDVFPRIRLGVTAPAPMPVVVHSTGSAEMDALLGGGILRGSSVLVTGAPGTGKSVLTTQCAVAAAERGERVAVYLFDERVGTFLERAAGLGMSVEKHVEEGRILLTPVEPTEISPGEFNTRILRAVASEGVRLVVVDSLNGFTKAMPEERQLTVKIHELLSYLGNRGVSTLLTLAQHGIFGATSEDTGDVSYLADAVILLRYFEAMGEVRRAISVVKQRSEDHERTIREFRVGHGGLRVGDPLREFQGVLTGVPAYTGAEAGLLRGGHAREI